MDHDADGICKRLPHSVVDRVKCGVIIIMISILPLQEMDFILYQNYIRALMLCNLASFGRQPCVYGVILFTFICSRFTHGKNRFILHCLFTFGCMVHALRKCFLCVVMFSFLMTRVLSRPMCFWVKLRSCVDHAVNASFLYHFSNKISQYVIPISLAFLYQ